MDNPLELYKSIFDDAVDAIFIGDEKGNFIIVNKSAEQLTGYTKTELLTLNMSNLFPKQILKQSPLKYDNLDSNLVITSEREIVRKDGSLVPVEMKSKKLDTGNYQSFIRDITERKQSAKAIKESEEKYRALFELSPMGILLENSEGKIIEANPVIHKNYGYEENSLIGKSIDVIAHPDGHTEIKANIKKILSGKTLNHIVKSIKKDGSECYNELRETKISLPNIGDGILSISNDITKQVAAEHALKENEFKLRNIIEHSSNLFYSHTAAHKLTYVSPQSKHFFDCGPEEALVRWTDFISDNPINKLGFAKTQKAIDTGIVQEPYELELITKKGRTVIVEVHETPVVENGKTTSIVGALVDVSFRKKLESSYQELFEYAPIPFLEEDVTELFEFYDELKQNGISDIRKYLDDNPKLITECIHKIKPIRANQAGLELLEMDDLEHYKNNFGAIFTPKSLEVFKEQIIAFAKGIKTFSAETETVLPSGKKKHLIMKIQLQPKTESGRQTELFSVIDITQKKQAELALKKSKEQLEMTIESAELGMWDHNFKTSTVLRNNKWAEILGYSHDEVSTGFGDFLELIHPDDLPKIKKAEEEHLSGKSSYFKVEHRMKTKSGNWKWILNWGKVVEKDEQGNPIRALGTHLDITERKNNSELLKQYTQEIETIFQLSEEMVGNLNISEIINIIPKHIVQASNTTESASLWRHNESKDIFEVVSWFGYGKRKIEGFTLPTTNTLIGEVHRNKKAIICNDTAKNPMYKKESVGRSLITKATIGVPLISEEKVLYVIFADNYTNTNVFNNDDLKVLQSFANMATIAINNAQLYNKIIESEEKYRSIFDSSGESIFIHDFETGKTIDVNKKMIETFGFTYKEALQLSLEDSSSGIYPYTSKEVIKYIQKAKTDGPQLFEWHSKKKSGELFWTEVNLQKAKIGNDKRIVAVVRDITYRKNEERKKRELEVSYYNLFNNSSDAIYVLDKNGCFLDVNKGVFEMYGYTKGVMIGKTLEFVSADGKNDLEKISNYINDAFSNKPCQFEFWGKKKSGKIFAKLVRIKKGSYLGQDVVIAFALDITNQKNYEKELKRWADVFRYSKWGVVVGSVNEQELEMMNPAFAEMHGYTVEELVGKQADILLSPNEKSRLSGFRKKAHEKGQISFESEHLRKDGSTFQTFSNVSAIKDSEGNDEYRIINVQDITELKEAEKIIEQERDQAQKYLDVAGVMIGVLDVNGTITLINKKGLEILGYSENEIIGKNWFEIALPKEYVNEVKKVFAKTMKGKFESVEYYENPIITKNGDVKTIAFHNTILKTNNSKIIGVLFSGEDITLQKEATENLKRSKEEMDKLAQHLQDVREEERRGIATEIHDDLGQSLTALKLDASILLSKLPDADPEIIKKIISMKDLTDQTIKTVQRISSDLRPGILDDLGLAAALEWEIGKFEERTNIKCKLQLTPLEISFNEKLNITIFRLFQEACTNVARHSQATKLIIKITEENKKITIIVKDNGVGITKEQITSSKSFGIIGMRERLKNLKGSIIFTSKPNIGTTLDIKIPIKS